MPSPSIKERKVMLNKPISSLSYAVTECSSFKSIKEKKAKQRIAIKEFNDELLNLVTIQDKMEKIYPINEQQVTEINKLYDEIWKFDEPIKNLEILLAKSNAEEEIQLIQTTKKKISELKAELECKQDLTMQEESETFEKFSHLYRMRRIALDELYLKEINLEELGLSKTRINEVKESDNLGQSSRLNWNDPY